MFATAFMFSIGRRRSQIFNITFVATYICNLEQGWSKKVQPFFFWVGLNFFCLGIVIWHHLMQPRGDWVMCNCSSTAEEGCKLTIKFGKNSNPNCSGCQKMITQFGIFSGFDDVAEKNHCIAKHPNYDVFFCFKNYFPQHEIHCSDYSS